MSLTVSELRAALEHLPGDVMVVIDQERDHEYDATFSTDYTTALYDKRRRVFTEDIFVSDELGEDTEYGTRVNVLVLGA